MKKHKQGQSNSVILDHDASLQQLNDTLSLDNEPILSVNQMFRGSHGQGQNESKREEGLFLQDNQNLNVGTFKNFNSQLHLSGVMHHHNKDFAGETFSQISSTFEQQFAQPINAKKRARGQGNGHENKSHNLSQPDGGNIQNPHQNDDLLDYEILNKSSLNSPNAQAEAHAHKNFSRQPNAVHILSQNLNTSNQNINQNQSSFNYQNSGCLDEASVLRILDRTIADDFEDETEVQKMGVEQFENFKYESEDVLQMVSKIASDLKQYNKNSRHGSRALNPQKTVTINTEELKQLEIIGTAAQEKLREIQRLGTQLLDQQANQSFKQKQYLDNLKTKIKVQLQKQRSHCQHQLKRAEDQRFKHVINEYELNQRVSQLEEAFRGQQDEINLQANRNEQLKFEKQTMSKKYEKKMSEVETMVQTILKSMAKEEKHGVKKVNNSFSIEATNQSLLQPPTNYNHKKKQRGKAQVKDQTMENEKENESFVSNNADEAGSSSTVQPKAQKISVQSQLLNLQKLIKKYKRLDDQQQQEAGSFYQGSGSIHNLLSNLMNIQNDSCVQQSQMGKPESSQASVNQAFIGSLGSESKRSKGDSRNNTSFFGKELANDQRNRDERAQNLSSMISQIISSRRGAPPKLDDQGLNQQSSVHSYDDEMQKMVYDKFRDLSMTQQEKLIQQLWGNSKMADGMPSERRDVRIEDILEVSKKTFTSFPSSFRTGRDGEVGLNNPSKNSNKEQDQLNLLNILKNVNDASQINSDPSLLNQLDSMFQSNERGRNHNNKNNSTLEISFNHNEIQVLNGCRQKRESSNGNEDEEEKIFNNEDQSLKHFLQLDDKIFDHDMVNRGGKDLSGSKKLGNSKRQQVIMMNQNNFFGSSMGSVDLQMGGAIKSSNREGNFDQQNSVEEDMLILNNLCAKEKVSTGKLAKNNKFPNFTDLSLIEGNKSIGLNTGSRQGGLEMTGSIKKEGGGSLYSGGSSLLQLNMAFVPPKQNGPTQYMTVKVQGREVMVPKLDIQRVIALEKREPFKRNIVLNNNSFSSLSDSVVSQSRTVEPSSFQNESISKPLGQTVDKGSNHKSSSYKQQTLVNDLDKAVIVEEDEKNFQSENEDHEFGNMFGDFKQELMQEGGTNTYQGNDTLDFGDSREIQQMDPHNNNQRISQSEEKGELLQDQSAVEAIPNDVSLSQPDKPADDEIKLRVLSPSKHDKYRDDPLTQASQKLAKLKTQQSKENMKGKVKDLPLRDNYHIISEGQCLHTNKSSFDLSPNISMHKKSQSESQLMTLNNDQYKIIEDPEMASKKSRDTVITDPIMLSQQPQSLQVSSKGAQMIHINQISFNFGSIKTPKNPTKITLSSNHNQNSLGNCIKLVRSQPKKQRSTSSDLNRKLQNISQDQKLSSNTNLTQGKVQQEQRPQLDKIKEIVNKQQKLHAKQAAPTNTTALEQDTEAPPFMVCQQPAKQGQIRKNGVIKGSLIKLSKQSLQQRLQQQKQQVDHSQIKNEQQIDISAIYQTTAGDVTCNPDQSVIAKECNQDHNLRDLQKANTHQQSMLQDENVMQKQQLFPNRFKSLVKIAKPMKQSNETEQSMMNDHHLDESNLVQNYLSAAAVAGQQRLHPRVKQRATILKKGNFNSFLADQLSQRNNAGLSEQDFYNYGQSNESHPNQLNLINSGEFDMASGAKQSTLRTEETNSQSPPKKDKRGSQSCTPQKKMTVVSKQLIKINPTSKISNMNLRRISMSKRNLDQKSRQTDLVNQSEIVGSKAGIANNSILHSSNLYNSNVSHLLDNENVSLINADQLQLGAQSTKSKGTKLVKVVRRSKEKKQQQPINISNISVNISGQQPQLKSSKSNSKLVKKVQKMQLCPNQNAQADKQHTEEQSDATVMRIPKAKSVTKHIPVDQKLKQTANVSDIKPHEMDQQKCEINSYNNSLGTTKRSSSKLGKAKKKTSIGEQGTRNRSKRSGEHSVSLSNVSSIKQF